MKTQKSPLMAVLMASGLVLSIAIGPGATATALAEGQTNNKNTQTIKQAPAAKPQVKESQRDDILGPSHKRARELFEAVRRILNDTAKARSEAKKLPKKSDFILPPLWQETQESRSEAIEDLLNAALEIATDAPVVETQTRIRTLRENIAKMEEQIIQLKEKRLTAPEDALLGGILTDTVKSIDENIAELTTRIGENRKEIEINKNKIRTALEQSDIQLSPAQTDLLLGSVLGSDLLKIVASFDAAKKIDKQLALLMKENGNDIKSSRRYFAMHTALFAMIVHAQNLVIDKIDSVYLKRINAILDQINKTQAETRALLRQKNRQDQKRTLMANLKSQSFSKRVALFYRDYLKTQRDQLMSSRSKARRDLKIADNTFETVEASFQLRNLMAEAQSSFEAIEMLKSPGFDEVFQDPKLREEFEILTEKLTVPAF